MNNTNTELKTTENSTNNSKVPSLIKLIESEKVQNAFKMSLQGSLTPKRLTQVLLSECRKTPKLLTCDQMSFYNAIMQLAQLGLEVGINGECYLLPYDNRQKGITECQVIVGYKGLIKLARGTGEVSTIQANVVDEKDLFEFEYGTTPKLRHVPTRDPSNNVIFAYAVITFKDNSFQFTTLTRSELEKIKRCSTGAYYKDTPNSKHPWHAWEEEMMKKTALKRLFKTVSLSQKLTDAVTLDDNGSMNDYVEVSELKQTSEIQEKSATEQLINEVNEEV